MIKINSVVTKQGDVAVNVTYDLPDNKLRNVTYQINVNDLVDMSEEQIKTYLKNKVEAERKTNIQNVVAAKFKQLINVDLEPVIEIPEPDEPTVEPELEPEEVTPQ